MVVNIDMVPTLLQAAGVTIPADIQGESMMPLLTGKKPAKTWRTAMYYRYYEYPEPHAVPPHIGIRTQRYKLMRFEKPQPYWELYDLKTDKLEVHNLYGQPKYNKLVKELKQQLKQLALYYDDAQGATLVETPTK